MLTTADLRRPLPPSFTLMAAADTGTYMSLGLVAVADTGDLLVLEEFPNYRYVGGEIELLGLSNPEWAHAVMRTYTQYRPGDSRLLAWADPNTQFRAELAHYGIHLRGNTRKLELRTEITREYFQTKKIYFAPWLDVLPYEIENAQWPDDTTSAGKFERRKHHDHSLDWLEHICSRRPQSPLRESLRPRSFVERFMQDQGLDRNPMRPRATDPHLGRH